MLRMSEFEGRVRRVETAAGRGRRRQKRSPTNRAIGDRLELQELASRRTAKRARAARGGTRLPAIPAVQQIGQSCSPEWRGGQGLSSDGGRNERQAMDAWSQPARRGAGRVRMPERQIELRSPARRAPSHANPGRRLKKRIPHLRFVRIVSQACGVIKARVPEELSPLKASADLQRCATASLYPASKPERRSRKYISPLQLPDVITML